VLSRHFPDLDALEVLLAVARTGSLNAAATEVGVSQQAVSARIRSMEARTGLALVARTSRGSTLTPAGQIVAEWAARLVELASELDLGLASLRSDRGSRLRVSASLTIAEQLLPGWLVALNAEATRRGGARVEVVLQATNSETVTEQVRQGRAELGFVEGPAAPAGLRSRSIGRDRLVVVVLADHPWARRRQPVTPGELAGTALVSREPGSGTRESFDRALRAALGGSRPVTEPPFALSTTAAVRAAVLAGAGPGVLSELTVADDLSSGRLVAVPVSGIRLERTLRAIWLGGGPLPAGPARDLLAQALRSTQSAQRPRPGAR
jgi:molybdate transport repressor ModE-like protein